VTKLFSGCLSRKFVVASAKVLETRLKLEFLLRVQNLVVCGAIFVKIVGGRGGEGLNIYLLFGAKEWLSEQLYSLLPCLLHKNKGELKVKGKVVFLKVRLLCT